MRKPSEHGRGSRRGNRGRESAWELELRKRFAALRRVRATEEAVSGLFDRLRREEASGETAEGEGRVEPEAGPAPGGPGGGDRAAGRPFRWKPIRVALATALATLCVSVPLTFFAARGGAGGGAPGKVYIVRFVFEGGDASSVSVVGDFNDWRESATSMRRLPGTPLWTAEVPLSEGLYRYAFLIDEKEWTADPLAEIRIKDDFGKDSSLIVLVNDAGEGVNL